MKTKTIYISIDGAAFENEADCIAHEQSIDQTKELPYFYTHSLSIERKHNPKFDQDSNCACGHSYHRHFDPYENYAAVGCKYCDCFNFQPFTSLI